jgi:kinetochore protein Nuf2
MGMRRESVEALVRAAGAEQEFPQSQYDAALLMTFYRSLTQLMAECGVQDFTFNDLLKPDADRLRVNLSSVINFLRFRGERWDKVEKYFQKGEETKKRIEELYMANDDLEAKIQHLREQRKREESALQEAQTKNKNLATELRQLGKIQADVINEYQQLKDEKQQLRDTLVCHPYP